MARRQGVAIPAAPRRTLTEWIGLDDDNDSFTRPSCTVQVTALHARIASGPQDRPADAGEPLQPPAALQLPPLG
jgi:hypothetical protein